jgi:hypothetical protein
MLETEEFDMEGAHGGARRSSSTCMDLGCSMGVNTFSDANMWRLF